VSSSCNIKNILTEVLKLHPEAMLAMRGLLDRAESVDVDFQEFVNRDAIKRARLEDVVAAIVLQAEEHRGLKEAEVFPTSFHFRGIGSRAEARYSS
jgi:hypothetical protein